MSSDPREATVGSRRVHTGRVIHLDVDTVRFPDGTVGDLEIIRHPGASAIVPFVSDPRGADAQILLIRQYRYAAGGYIYEIPAGRLDEGEAPVDCAHRELREETGCTARRMEHLYTTFTTPGFTDEKIHVFMATDLTRGATGHEADEFMEIVPMTLTDALARVESGEINDAKTALALLYVAGFRSGR
ncbi:MAG: NUDIX hydrolase [Gemmatimonadaceae bacterium]